MKSKRLFCFCVILLSVFLLSACTVPHGLQWIISFPQGRPVNSVAEKPAKAKQTVTPSFTPGPTATATVTASPTKTLTSTPTSTPTLTPTPAIPDDQVNIMIFGNDYRPALGGRTDVIILVSINTDDNVVNVISFPRDLYVEIPGRGYDRLNTAFPYGGFDLFQKTMQWNFNIKPDYYLMTNFNGFVSIIDSLGGVDVYVSYNLVDRCDLVRSSDGYCSVGPGTVHMDGDLVLWYVRSRYTSNDFDRNLRQQEVLLAILRRMLQWDLIANASSLYNNYQYAVDTDLPLDEFIRLIPTALSLNQDGHLNQYAIDSNYTTNFRTEQGAAVLMPDEAKIDELILKVIFEQE